MPGRPERSAGKPADRSDEAAALLARAERPAIMAGTGLYWAHGEEELRALAEALGIPVFLNGMGRGCLPADHELCFSRARGKGLKEADVALVVGVPLDFRLAFGGSFGEETKLVSLDVVESELKATRQPDLRWSATSPRRSPRSARRPRPPVAIAAAPTPGSPRFAKRVREARVRGRRA